MTSSTDDTGVRELVEQLEAELRRTNAKLTQLQDQLESRRRWGPSGSRLVAAIGVCLVMLGGVRLVFADSPSASGEHVPRQISYRGYLESNGTPVTGQTDMTFELYASATSGSMLWSESRSVPVVNGAFAVDLGDCSAPSSTCTKPLSDALATSPPALYVGVKVAGSALSGRQRLMSVPYALRTELSANSSEATHAASSDNAINASHASAADTAANATHAITADSASSATSASAASRASSVDLVSMMTAPTDAFAQECKTTRNAQQCGVLAHRKCNSLGHAEGIFVGESPDDGNSMLVTCLH